MDEYIKREDALDAVLFALCGTGYQSRAINAIRELPTADVVPKGEYDAVVSAVNNSTKEFLKLHDDYQKQKSERTELLRSLKCEIHEKATYPSMVGISSFIPLKVFDAVLQTYVNKYKE